MKNKAFIEKQEITFKQEAEDHWVAIVTDSTNTTLGIGEADTKDEAHAAALEDAAKSLRKDGVTTKSVLKFFDEYVAPMLDSTPPDGRA